MLPSIWQEWDGTGFPREHPESALYFIEGEVDLSGDSIMLRSLARTLKEDGVASSVSEALDLLEDAYVTGGEAIDIDDEVYAVFGEEYDENTSPVTWVEVIPSE